MLVFWLWLICQVVVGGGGGVVASGMLGYGYGDVVMGGKLLPRFGFVLACF